MEIKKYDYMQIVRKMKILQDKIHDLTELALGCDEHTTYRYFRAPKADCERCEYLYTLATKHKLRMEDDDDDG